MFISRANILSCMLIKIKSDSVGVLPTDFDPFPQIKKNKHVSCICQNPTQFMFCLFVMVLFQAIVTKILDVENLQRNQV